MLGQSMRISLCRSDGMCAFLCFFCLRALPALWLQLIMCLTNTPIILEFLACNGRYLSTVYCIAAAGVSFLWCIILSTMQGKYDAEASQPEGKKLENEQGDTAPV